MNTKQAIDILEKHQAWRRDNNVPSKLKMQNPTEIDIAIDYAINILNNSTVWAFQYNSNIFESAFQTISLHMTVKGAYDEMKKHKLNSYYSWLKFNDLRKKQRGVFSSGYAHGWSEEWRVIKIKVNK